MIEHTFVEISTKHITKEDTALLQSFAWQQLTCPEIGELLVYAGPFGWFVWVSSEETIDDMELELSLKKDGFSTAMYETLVMVRDEESNWIRFDRDAELSDGLEVVYVD